MADPHAQAGEPDPSMDDILASIRRILSEEERAAPPVAHAALPPPDDVLELDDSMLVTPPSPAPRLELPMPEPATDAPHQAEAMLAPDAQAATAIAMGSLRRTIEARATMSVARNGGPSLEDLVREELRPVLKAWLDAHLPPLVERLVAAEIERLVARSAS